MLTKKKFFSFATGRKKIWLFVLVASMLFLLARVTPVIVLNLIISPRVDADRQGWWASFSSPVRPLPVQGYQVFLAGTQTIALNPDFHGATLWTVWRVSRNGRYKLHYSADGYSRVSIDGTGIFTARPRNQSGRIEKRWVGLKAGPHLIRVDVSNQAGGGWISIGVLTPPLMRFAPLTGPEIGAPVLGNLKTWWWTLHIARLLALTSLVLAGIGFLIAVLPLTVDHGWPGVGLLLLLSLLPALLVPDVSKREPYIGAMLHRQLREVKPRFVFIGNSMLWSRIDDRLLSKLLGGVPVFSIVNFGGLSGIHYLALKYLLVPADVHPKKVFIFFRGTTLLDPSFRTTGPYFETLIQRISPAPDPVFERLAHGKDVTEESWCQRRFKRIFRLQANRQYIRDQIGQLALALTRFHPGHREEQGEENLRKRINKRFSLKNVGGGMDQEALKKNRGLAIPADFTRSAQHSFLPPLFQLARQHGFQLVFVRVQERPETDTDAHDSEEMKAYIARLKEYLEEHGAVLYDFTGDPQIPLSMYGQGDHIADPAEYTPIFYNRMRELLQ